MRALLRSVTQYVLANVGDQVAPQRGRLLSCGLRDSSASPVYSHVNYDVSPGSGDADQHAPWVRPVQRLGKVVHLPLNQLGAAGVTDARAAAEVGA